MVDRSIGYKDGRKNKVNKKLDLAVFASGRGSNFRAILNAIQHNKLDAEIKLLLSNNPDAGAVETAKEHQIPAVIISSQDFRSRKLFVEAMLSKLDQHGVELVALAGYMKKIPTELILAYRNRIVNIHPALLPSFGGKGMYGHHVHEAVIERGCKVTGVTVHIVDEVYDHGPIVAQRCVPVEEGDTTDTLAERVLKVEHQLYAEALQLFAEGRVEVKDKRAAIHP
jgi:formyltetrahydrofolate-dependent phosphoribosylglycinamide formyltransferase